MDKKIPKLPPRDIRSHKGNLGTIAVIGGSYKLPFVMYGGTVLCALAALRTGVGKCTLAMPEPLLAKGIKILPQAMGIALPQSGKQLKLQDSLKAVKRLVQLVDCLVIGPALGDGKTQPRIVRELLRQGKPVVLDAGALNASAFNPDIWDGATNANTILTPHGGEFERLVKGFGLPPASPDKQADHLAAKLKTIVILKNSQAYITDGKQKFVYDKPNPALAAGGSGDVLAGIIGGLITQYFTKGLSLFDCAVLGVAIHNRAGQLWSVKHGDRGLIIQELTDFIPEAMRKLT